MAEITSFTADRLQATEDAKITGSSTDGAGRVTLNRQDGGIIQLPSVNFPSGAVMMFASGVVPTGWLLCNGQAVSRATYSSLFGVIGTTYGAGDGSSTFNIPNMEASFPRMQAASLGTKGGAATHAHSHTHAVNKHDHELAGGTTPAIAHIYSGGVNLYHEAVGGAASWNTDRRGTLDLSPDVAAQSNGVKVSGLTALDGNNTNSDATNSSALPPYVNVNFIIKV